MSERGGEAGNPKGGGQIWPCRLAVLGLAASVLGRVPSASVLGLAGPGSSASVVGLVVLVVNLAGLLAFSIGFGCECGVGARKMQNNSLQLCLHHIGTKTTINYNASQKKIGPVGLLNVNVRRFGAPPLRKFTRFGTLGTSFFQFSVLGSVRNDPSTYDAMTLEMRRFLMEGVRESTARSQRRV